MNFRHWIRLYFLQIGLPREKSAVSDRSLNRYVCHSRRVLEISKRYGWKPGARYTNLRDVRHEPYVGFLDIDWKNYSFDKHLWAAELTKPEITVAQDIVDEEMLVQILRQAELLKKFSDNVIIVPKDPRLSASLLQKIPEEFLLGFSVPTQYGGTMIEPKFFDGRPVHLLGGRPDIQRKLAEELNVVSLDTNRFTLDASFGDYFDGKSFRPHPVGGYETCLEDSLTNINRIWRGYRGPRGESEDR